MTSTSLVGDTFFGIDLRQASERLRGMRRQVSKRVLLLEFDTSSLRLGEARFLGGGLQVDHLTRFVLPDDALERGVPHDPLKMGGLVKELCREKQISVHRSAVVLPTEVAFQRLIALPAGLVGEGARDYLLDPTNGLQIPIPLSQADFDLQPTVLPSVQSERESLQTYLLTAIPSNLLDRVIETLQVAELELQALEIGAISQLRLMATELLLLKQLEVRLVLELKTECTHFTLVSASGPVWFERLAAIREFPEPVLTEEQTISTLEEGVLAEQISIHQENYLAIGELDLRILVSEVRDALKRFSNQCSGFRMVDIVLTGRNSAHPFLPALLKEEFDCFVRALEPSLSVGIEGLQFDNVLVQKSLNRLLGLGLGLLPSHYLLSNGNPEYSQQTASAQAIPLVDVTPAESYLLEADHSFDENQVDVDSDQELSANQDKGEMSAPVVEQNWPSVSPDSVDDSALTELSDGLSIDQDLSTKNSISELSPPPLQAQSSSDVSSEWPSIHDSDPSSQSSTPPNDACLEDNDLSPLDVPADEESFDMAMTLKLGDQLSINSKSLDELDKPSDNILNTSSIHPATQSASVFESNMNQVSEERGSVDKSSGDLADQTAKSRKRIDSKNEQAEHTFLGELRFRDDA